MQNKVIRILSIAACVLLVVALGVNAFSLSSAAEKMGAAGVISTIAFMATSVFAIYYILAGAKKGEGSAYFRIFMAMFGLSLLLVNLLAVNLGGFSSAMVTLSFGCLSILFVAKDLGFKWSVALSAIVVLCAIPAIVSFPHMATATYMLLALVTLLMVCAKYADKAARRRK